jgi:hypothetical protein
MKKNEEFFYFDPKKVQSHPLIVTKGIECMEAERVYLMAVAQDHSANRPDPPTTEEVCNWVFSSIIGAHAIHKWIPGGNEKMGVTWTNDELFGMHFSLLYERVENNIHIASK